MQRLLHRADGDIDEVREDVLGYVAERLGDGVLIAEGTGFLKKTGH